MTSQLLFVIAAVSAYLICGLNPAIALSRAIYHEDIREKGSKNPGFTNFKRVYGNTAWIVFVLDVLKSVLPCVVFGILFGKLFDMRQIGVAFTGFFAILGHSFPVWYRFKGGKGFLCAATAIFLIDWRVGLICAAVFVILLFTVKFMSLSSISAAFVAPIALAIIGFDEPKPWVLVCCIVSAALVIARHHENIKRLISGTEKKFSLFGKKK